MKKTTVTLFLAASMLAGCSSSPTPGGATGTPKPVMTASGAPATPAGTASPSASGSPSATPGASGTPDASGSPVSADWKSFKAPDSSFSCVLPGTPQSVSDPTGNGFQARCQLSPDKGYMVGFIKMAGAATPEARKKGWDAMLAEMKKKGAEQKDIAQDGIKGVELSFSPEEKHMAKVRYFMAEDRIYMLMAVDSKENKELAADSKKLFDSFKMTPPPPGSAATSKPAASGTPTAATTPGDKEDKDDKGKEE